MATISDKQLRDLIDKLDSIEADSRSNESRITSIRMQLLRLLNGR